MDMPEVKAFNAELSGLYDNKPPISKAKMSAITRGAIKAIKFYKHVVHSVEKFIQKCKPEYKVPGLYVIDSIVRQSRHQFGQDKDVFAPRFAKNMQQTFANLFRCPPENKGNIIRVLNLWQKNNVFGPEVIQPLMDMADPNHPLHQEIQQQQNNTANGSSLTLNTSHNSDKKISPVPAPLHTPPDNSPMGDSFQDQPSGNQGVKFNRKLLSNDFEYESDDDGGHDTHTSHATHSTHSTHASHSTHTQPQQTADTLPLGSILTNPEIMRQLQSLQAQMQLMTGMSGMQIPNLMPMMSELQQNQNQPFLNKEQQKQNESKDDMVESDIEFVETGPQVIEIPDANDSRSPSPRRRHRSRSRSRGGRRRRTRSRSRSSRSPRRRRDKERDRERDRDRTKDNKSHKEREADKEKQREREKKGLPPIKKENLSVCSTTLWVGHLSKLATQEELSDLFGAVGGVTSIDVVAPRGCAFVVMERRRDAHKALTTLNKHKLHSKEIAVAWAPGKGVKGREWKDYWEAELGVSYLPWGALQQRWALGALSLDALEDGGAVDEETLPPWLPPRILPKTLMDGMVGMMPMGMPGPAGMPPMPNAMPNPLQNAMPNAMQNAMPNAMPGPMPGMPALQLPPPGMGPGLPPGMPPGMPPGLRPPNMPQQVPGMQPEAGMPPTSALLRFPGMPPQPIQSMQSMPQPGMAALPGFLGGLLAVGGLVGGVPLHHAPPQHQQMQQRVSEVTRTDDAMDLDTEDTHNEEVSSEQPPPLSDQLQALLSKPPPGFNSSEPPPPFNLSEPPPTAPNTEDKQDDKRDRDRRDRDRDRRDRGDRDRRDRERGNRDRERGGRDRDRDRGDRDRERDRDRGGRDRRDRDRDRDNRDRFNAPRDNNNREQSRSKSPREGGAGGEKSLQERLWEMANGKRDEFPQPQQQDNIGPEENRVDRPPLDRMPRPGMDGEGDAADDWRRVEGPHAPPFRPDPRMRGPRPPVRGPWMEQGPGGPGGPGGQGPPFGARFNGLGPPPGFPGPGPGPGPRFERPPFARMPFDGPARPPFDGGRPPFDGPRPPFDGPRPPFDGPRFDGPRAPFDGPRPPFDGNRPPFDGPRPPFDGPRPPFDGPRPPFDGPRPFDGPFDGERPFDGPPEFFNNRRFEDREFNDRGWNGDRERGDRDWNDRRTDWDDRRRDRFRDKDNEDRSGQDRFDRNRNDRRRNFDDRNDRDRDRSDRDRSDRDKSDRDKSDRDRPKREERSRADRQKDRKSRWGAAEELKEGETSTEAAEAPKESTEAPKEVSTEQPEQMDIRSNQEQNVETKEPARNQRVESKEQASECAPMETESTIDTHQEREPVEIETKQYEEAPESQSFDDSQQAEEPANREETRESYEERVEVPMDEPREETRTFEAAPVSEVTETPDLYDANDAVDTSFSIAPEKNETEDRIESTETENRIVSTEESKSEDIFEPSKGEP